MSKSAGRGHSDTGGSLMHRKPAEHLSYALVLAGPPKSAGAGPRHPGQTLEQSIHRHVYARSLARDASRHSFSTWTADDAQAPTELSLAQISIREALSVLQQRRAPHR